MDKWLVGNGYWCKTCGGTGGGRSRRWGWVVIARRSPKVSKPWDRCAECYGSGRLPYSPERVIRDTIRAADQKGER